MRLSPLLFCALMIAACGPSEPPDLTGSWKRVDAGPEAVTLELRRDGSFVRTAAFGDLAIKQAGQYRVERDRILFQNIMEGIAGEGGTEVQGVVKTPFAIRGRVLVFYPGSDDEEEYILMGDAG